MVELVEGLRQRQSDKAALESLDGFLKDFRHKPLLVLALGNPSRGDDAIPHEILTSISETFEQLDEERKPAWRLLEQMQLVQENIFDLKTVAGCIIIDVSLTHRQLSFEKLHAAKEYPLTSHSLAPEALLYWYQVYYQQSFDTCYLLAIPAQQFVLGEKISLKGQSFYTQICARFKKVITAEQTSSIV